MTAKAPEIDCVSMVNGDPCVVRSHTPKANMRTPCVLRLLPLRTGSDLHLQLSSASR
jgi:hypothetical protein